jgi:hypothetical protein
MLVIEACGATGALASGLAAVIDLWKKRHAGLRIQLELDGAKLDAPTGEDSRNVLARYAGFKLRIGKSPKSNRVRKTRRCDS